jgi:hypothetical protein
LLLAFELGPSERKGSPRLAESAREALASAVDIPANGGALVATGLSLLSPLFFTDALTQINRVIARSALRLE